MEPRLRHVFFDVTGTLLGVRGSVGAIYSECARRHGLVVAAESIERSFQEVAAASPQRLVPGQPVGAARAYERDWWHDVAQRSLAPFGPFPAFEAFFAEVFEAFRGREAWVLLPGVTATLQTLRAQGRRLGIVSDMDSRLYDVLRAFDLAPLFDVICLSFECRYQKPDVRLFRTALARAGAEAARAVHVGDSIKSDVRGALAAGMHAVYLDVVRSGRAPGDAHVVHALDELPALLARLEGPDPEHHGSTPARSPKG